MNYSINKKLFKSKELLIINYSLLILLLSSCSVSSQISKEANKTILRDSAASKGFIGISIYDPATGKYLYNYNATKYFTPASNTKLFSLYAGMKYLGDSLVGAMVEERWDGIRIFGTGDPTFLHPDFKYQPVFDYLRSKKTMPLWLERNFDSYDPRTGPIPVYGDGWSWSDYNDDYMAERNFFPIYGNVVRFNMDDSGRVHAVPKYFERKLMHFKYPEKKVIIKRDLEENSFNAVGTKKPGAEIVIPFKTGEDFGITTKYIMNTVDSLLSDTLGVTVNYAEATLPKFVTFRKIRSQPADSLFRPMMHRSDNFFAEQTLLMVSNERLGYMNDADIIDTLLNTDLKDIPQRPKWVDGSGLSRYNLFTPQSFIYILNKLRTEFGWDRVRNILPTGGEGTLSSYFHKDSGFIYAKTGTLSNNCALSGFLLTDKGKLLIFSILANHYQGGATPIRKASERFLEAIRHKY